MKKIISLLLTCSVFCAAFTGAAVHAQESESISVSSVADTYADCRNNPSTNYGSEAYMKVSRVGNASLALMKFMLPELPAGKSVDSAVLRLTNRGVPADGAGVKYFAARLSDDDWEESTIVGSEVYSQRTPNGIYTYPAAGTSKIYTEYPPDAARDTEVLMDITAIINYEYTVGSEETSVIIGTDADKNSAGGNLGDWTFFSNEGPAGKAPELILTFNEGSYIEMDIDSLCIESAYTNKNQPDTEQPLNNTLAMTKNQRKVYLKFNIENIPDGFTVINAVLDLTVDSKEGMSDGMVKLNSVDNGWVEDGLAWSNAPETIARRAECTVGEAASGRRKISFDITDYLQEKVYNGSGEISVELESEYRSAIEGVNDNVNVYSHRYSGSERHPALKITVSNNPDIAAVVEDKVNLLLPAAAKEDISLPSEGENGSQITWTTSNEEVISADGAVTRYSEDKTADLTAHLAYNDITIEKTFHITVPSVIAEGGVVTFYNFDDNMVVDSIGDTERVNARVRLEAMRSGTAKIIVVRYTNSGGLLSVDVKEGIEMTAGERVDCMLSEINSSRAGIIKILVWNSLDEINPVLKNYGMLTK